MNYAGYDNPRVQEIFVELNTLADQSSRAALFTELQEILAADVPWLVLAQPNFDLPVSARVSNWVQPVDGLFRLYYLDT